MDFAKMRNDGFSDLDIVESLRSNELLKDTADFDGLRQKGIGDTQIVDMLNALPSFHEDVTKRKENYLASQTPPTTPTPTPPPPQEEGGFLGTIKKAGELLLKNIFDGKSASETLDAMHAENKQKIAAQPDGMAKDVAQGMSKLGNGIDYVKNDAVPQMVKGMDNAIEGIENPTLKTIAKASTYMPTPMGGLRVVDALSMSDKERKIADVKAYAENMSQASLLYENLFGEDTVVAKDSFDKISQALMKTDLADTVEMDNNNQLWITKDGQEYRVEDGFLKNLASTFKAYEGTIVGGTTGAIVAPLLATAGKIAPSPAAKVGLSALGAMAGSVIGAATDQQNASASTGLSIDPQHLLKKMTEEGVLSLAADGVVYGAIQGAKAIKPAYQAGKDFITGDARAYTQMKTDLRIDDDYTKGALDKLNGLLETPLSDTKQARMYATALEHEQGLSVMQEVLRRSEGASNTYEGEVVRRTQGFLKLLEDNAVTPKEILSYLEEASENVSAQYGAMRDILRNELKDVPPVTIDTEAVAVTLKEIGAGAHDPDVKSGFKSLASFIKNNPNYTSDIDGLLELRQDINRFFGKRNVKEWVAPDNAKVSMLIKGIDEAIYKTFEQTGEQNAKALKEIFEAAKDDYSAMKKAEASSFFKKLDADGLTSGQRAGRLVKGLSSDDESAQKVLSQLSPQQRERLEITAIHEVIQKEISGSAGGLKAVDFEDVIVKLRDMSENMNSKAAKDTLDFVEKMGEFFAKDKELIKSSSPLSRSENPLSTSLQGKLHISMISKVLEWVQRKIPFSEHSRRLDVYYRLGKYMETSHDTKGLLLKLYNDPLNSQSERVFFGKALSNLKSGGDDALGGYLEHTDLPPDGGNGGGGVMSSDDIKALWEKETPDIKNLSEEELKAKVQDIVDKKYGVTTPKGDEPTPPSGGGIPPKGTPPTNPPKEPSGGDIEAPKIDETTKVEPDVTMDEALHVKPKEGVSDGVQGQKEALGESWDAKVETPVAKEVDSETFRQRMNDIIEEKLAQQSEAPAPKAPTTGEDELKTPSMENIFHPDNEVMGKSIFLASNPQAKRFVAGEKIEEQIIEGLEFFWNKTDKDIVEVTSGLRFPVETTDKAKAIQEAIALLKSEPQKVNLIKKAVAQSEGMLEKLPFEPMNFKEGSAFVDGFEVPLDIAIASSKTVSTPKELSRKLFEAQESLDRMITSTSNNDYNKKRKRLSEMRHNQQEDTALYQTLKAELENIEAFKDKDFLSKLQKAEEKVKKLEAEVTQTYHQDGQKVASKIQDQVPSDELMESVERSMETVSKSKSAQRIEDVGVKIGGARKDTWVGRGLNLDDVKTMSGGEASKYVIKENIIPKIDYEALHAEGKLSKEAIATIKIVRDGLGAKPKSDSAQGREAYMTSMAIAKGLLDDMISGTVPFSSIRNEARARFGYADGKLSEEARALLVPILKGRYSPFDVSSYDVSRLLRKGFLGDAYKLTQFDVKVDGDFVKQWGIYDNKKGTLLRDENGKWFKFENEESASAFMQTYEPPKKTKGVKEEPKRPHLDSQIRQGDDVREGIDVDAEMLRKTFGFRGVEFGNWAANDERQKFINLGYDALSDLSDILNIPKEAIALDGKLGFAFGARGVSGASAHYEPAKVVINLTKMNGAGAMAHEWGHALDHYLGELNTLNSYGGAPKYLSGGTDAPKIRHLNTELREEVQTAARGVMEAMFEKDMPKADVIRQHELSIENYDKKLTNWGHYANQASLTAKEKQNAKQAMDELQYLKQNAQKQIQAITDGAFNPRKTPSEYRTNAQAITGKGDYWQRPTEMWARAFESYVYDKLAKVDRVNSYLVWGVENAHYVEKPYPEGMEREAINKAFDTLFATLKAEKTDKGMRLGYIDEASAKFMAKSLSGAGLGAIPEHDYNGDGVIDASDRLIGYAMGIVAFHTLTSKSAFASYKTMAEHGVQKLAQRAQAGDMIAQSVLGTRYVITSEKGTVMLAEEVTHGFKAFKDVALSDGRFDKEFNFGLISESAVEKLKRMTGLNFQGYQRIVDANHIRHTKNSHPDDLYIYDDLLDIFENFDYAQRTPEGLKDKVTRQPVIGIELYRKHENGLIEYVELRDFNNKTLKLKTTLTVDKELADQKLPRDLRLWTDADYRSKSPQSSRLKTNSDGFNENSIAQKGQK